MTITNVFNNEDINWKKKTKKQNNNKKPKQNKGWF